jgi:hypothetical protein
MKTYDIWEDEDELGYALIPHIDDSDLKAVNSLMEGKPKLILTFKAKSWENAKKRYDRVINKLRDTNNK